MIPLDLFVYSDDYFNTNLSGELGGRKIPLTLGIDARFEILPESLLPEGKRGEGDFLPEEAIVLVHGNAMQGYRNISYTRRLSEQRPDLRFVISVDTRYGKGDYADLEDYDYAKQLLGERFTSLKPVTVTNHHPGAFLSGVSAGILPVTRSFEKYLRLWKMLKEGHVFTLVMYLDRDLSSAVEDNEALADKLGMLYKESHASEHCLAQGVLETGEAIPQNAVVLVHGNFTSRYDNLSHVRKLMGERLDLYWIVTVDERTVEERYFQSLEDCDLVKRALEEDFSAAQRVAVTTANPLGFMRGNNVGDPIDCSLENYMKSWKQIRGLQ